MEAKVSQIIGEIKKAIKGKDSQIERVLTAILAGGHILLEDVPGVGKTTLALAISKALGLDFGRVQFTPDVVPSDITGFTVYDKAGGSFAYRKGAVITNFFLADEINRTSSKTQSALLEVMQEGRVTVDGQVHPVPQPFIVMATQNPVGTAGTQMLPEAQLDRFMIKISMGYPDADAQVEILQGRQTDDPLASVTAITDAQELTEMKNKAKALFVDEKILRYITALTEATRDHQYVRLGVSPRGALALGAMAKAKAFIEDRDYVVPEDIQQVFFDTFNHRLMLLPKAGLAGTEPKTVLDEILEAVKAPKL